MSEKGGKNKMRILVACEESQAVMIELRKGETNETD